ncbi:hypothetical protein E4T56_gene1726 [Termitomyces sp. T112]|nr:hypothetical protein E4T56_gene1726 [Termitomyces sp. T112]
MSSKTPSRFQDIRFTVVEIEDPDAPILRILNVHDPLLEPDGSLNVSQILWLRKGDIYMGYTKTEGVYANLIHPNLSSVIPSSKIHASLLEYEGICVLALIRADRFKDTRALEGAPDTRWKPELDLDFPSYPSSSSSSQDPRSHGPLIVVRQIRDFDDEEHRVVRTWTVALDPDNSLDTSKLTSIKSGEIYVGRRRGENFDYLIHNGFPRIQYCRMAAYLSELPGVVHPVLLLLNLTDYKAMLARRRIGNDII